MSQTDSAVRAMLESARARQRRAHLAQPVPSLAERRQDLRTLQRFVREHKQALCDAISADYGHRSRHETLLAEIFPVTSGIDHALGRLRGWMKPQRRHIDRLTFGLASNRVIPQPLGVVGVIVPWNFPLNLSFVPLTCIFAAGNRAMVKMSENSRHLAQLLIERIPAYFAPEKLQFFDETGGVGESGIGHYHGREGFETFSKLRPVFYQSRFSSMQLLAPPFGRLANRVLDFLIK